ncbi:MAG TPA: endonuclease/exonuclease/phosphatase family protein [Polyangiaceae bacterium]|nr:endonuclease/exonuclease/phosphatase family protein [Polyangiaceae bacterium]
MRVMTYNVLTGGRDADGPGRLHLIADTIRHVNPDVLVLNECNGFEQEGYRTLFRMEAELGMRGVLAEADTGFHVALFHRVGRLTEARLLSREVHHAVLSATLEVAGTTLRVIGAHLCPFGGDARLLEVQHLIRFLREDNVLILGDLNALSPHDVSRYQPERWLPRRRSRHLLAEAGGKLDTRAISALEEAELVDVMHARGGADPTVLTRLGAGHEDYQARIDYVFASRASADRVTRAERVSGGHVEAASDHYPLFVDLSF